MAKAKTLAIEAERRAAEVMMRHFSTDMNVDTKTDGTVLTVADTSINDLVKAMIRESFPDHGFLGEEGSYMPSETPEYVWVATPSMAHGPSHWACHYRPSLWRSYKMAPQFWGSSATRFASGQQWPYGARAQR